MRDKWLALRASIFFTLLFHGTLPFTDAAAQDMCTLGHDHDESEEDRPELREAAARPVAWRAAATAVAADTQDTPLPVQILAINDFHGQVIYPRQSRGYDCEPPKAV